MEGNVRHEIPFFFIFQTQRAKKSGRVINCKIFHYFKFCKLKRKTMFKIFISLSRLSLVIFPLAFLFVAVDFCDYADARSRGGGRSFSRSRTVTKTPAKKTVSPTRQTTSPTRSGGFMRSMAGGIAGGFLGSMLFSGLAGAGGMGGGFGGSGIGLIEILLLGGLLYFLYKTFFKRPAPAGAGGFGQSGGVMGAGLGAQETVASQDTMEDGLSLIAARDPEFDPEWFKEVAQDVFFKIQAGWCRRDLSVFGHLLGTQLLAEYGNHFAEMKEKGEINRIENIAVRKVQIVDAGIDNDEEFVSVFFTANLLDYTVDENTSEVLSGNPTEPVKFQETWTFARRVGEKDWKLEGIKE